jgi:hypothetical protein
VARGGVEPPTFRFSVGRSYQLSYLAWFALTPVSRGERVHTVPEHLVAPETDHAPLRGRSTVVAVADDLDIRHRISKLVGEERSLRDQLSAGAISTDEEHARLQAVETELDQCWDLLRQRDALRAVGTDPAQARARSADVVEKYLG